MGKIFIEVKKKLAGIFIEIQKENNYSTRKWGIKNDDMNTINDWVVFIQQYATKASGANLSKKEQRDYLIKVANIAISAVESLDRNGKFPNRHYDLNI